MKPTNVVPVNFIKHIDVLHEVIGTVDAINYTHIAVYLSLFRFWNNSFFTNPISPTRDEIMKYAGLKSKESFYRVIREMENLDLIRYYPSRSKYEKSFYCLSHLEFEAEMIKISVFGLSNHIGLKQGQAELPDASNKEKIAWSIVDIRTKAELYNGRGILLLEKTIFIKDGHKSELSRESTISTFDPNTDPRYQAPNVAHNPQSSKNTSYANYQNPQSRNSNLRPSGVQVDPKPNYTEPL
jgi:hypothetical protein